MLLVILPPLIYSAGVSMSWREFRFNLRPIALLAFGCVVFTTCAVAAAVHCLLNFDWAVAFLLGAIVAPPDVVAPLAIARRLGLPRRHRGDARRRRARQRRDRADPLPLRRRGRRDRHIFARQAAGTFALIVVGEIIYGIAIGWLSLRLRQWARDPRVEITLSLMTPYLAYWVPEHLGGSGVLATVACGLYVSWNGPLLIPSATRLQGIFFWDLIIYLIEGLVFLLTGLQARTLIEQAHAFSIHDLLIATAWTTLIAIAARFIWVFPATYLPRWLSPPLRKRDPSPPWQAPFLLAFTGVRGVVSLAAALAIPFTLANGAAVSASRSDPVHHLRRHHHYPGRPGPDAAAVIRWLGLATLGKEERKDAIKAELARAPGRDERGREAARESHRTRPAGRSVAHLRTRNQSRMQILPDEPDRRARAHAR